MIWQEEILKDRRKKELRMFYAGVCFGVGALAFVLALIVRATGGCP